MQKCHDKKKTPERATCEVAEPQLAEPQTIGNAAFQKRNLGDESESSEQETPVGGASTHVVEEGDTLFDIAEKQLGDGFRYPEIHQLNRSIIGPDPDVIEPGQRLRLPR